MPRAGDIHGIRDVGWMVPPGRYLVTVESGVTSDNGSAEVWQLKMRATTGHLIEDRITWSERAMFRGKIVCDAMGVDLESDPDATITAESLVGRQCEVEVEARKWTGDDGVERDGYRVTIRGYHPLSTGAQQQAAPPAAQQVRPLFGATT